MRRFALSLAVTASGLALLAGCSATPAAAPATSATSAASPAATSAAPASTTPAATMTPTTATTAGANAAECLAVGTMLNDGAAAINKGVAKMGKNPKKGLKLLTDFADEFRDSLAQISDPALAKEAKDALKSVEDLNAGLAKLVKDPTSLNQAGLQKLLTNLQTEFADLGTVCGG